MNVELTVDLIKGRETPWPRIENAEWMMSLGAARPLEDAARIAFKDMVQWVMEKTGLPMLDAYQFVSQNAVAPVIEIVDPLYTVLVKIPEGPPAGSEAFQRRSGLHSLGVSGVDRVLQSVRARAVFISELKCPGASTRPRRRRPKGCWLAAPSRARRRVRLARHVPWG